MSSINVIFQKYNEMNTLFIFLICLTAILASDITVQNRKSPKNKPSDTTINRRKGEVNANFVGLRGAKKSKLRQATEADLKAASGEGTIRTQNNDKLKVSRVKGPNGEKTPTVAGGFQGSRGKSNAVNAQLGEGGGNANTGKRHPGGTWSKDRQKNTEADVFLGKKNVQATGDKNGEFNTETQYGNKQKIRQTSSSKTSSSAKSQGTLELNQKSGKSAKANGDYNYKLDTNKNTGGKAQLSDAAGRPGRSGLQLDCNVPKVGETGCVNQVGKKTPTVVVDEKGHARLTKDGTALARVNTEVQGRKPNQKFVTNIEGKRSKSPTYLSSVEGFKQSDCYKEITKKNDPDKNDIKFTKRSMKFRYSSDQRSDGSVGYEFPDCFTVEAEVTLGPNIDVKDLAVEFQARINPLGDVSCADPATCGRGSCYYCDLCDKKGTSSMSVLENVDNEDTCAAGAGSRSQRVKLKATFCPPPPTEEFPLCTSFSRPYTSSYWTNNQDPSIISRVLIWQRPKNRQELSDRFFYCINGGSGCALIGDFRSSLKVSYLVEQGLDKGLSRNVPDEVLREFYIRQQLGRKKDEFKEKLLACEKGVMDYDVAGSKVGGKFLVEAASVLTKKNFGLSNAFVEAPCPKIQKLETANYNSMQKDWEAQGSNRGSDGGLLSSLGGLGGGSSGGSGSGGIFGRFG